MELTRAQRIELFHLAFLQVFLVGTRKERCILKGGANLRYFFHSARYSNDIDLDVAAPEGWPLERAVDGVLSSGALTRILEAAGVGIEPDSISNPKQTLTIAIVSYLCRICVTTHYELCALVFKAIETETAAGWSCGCSGLHRAVEAEWYSTPVLRDGGCGFDSCRRQCKT